MFTGPHGSSAAPRKRRAQRRSVYPSKRKGLVWRAGFLEEVRSASCNVKGESAQGRGEEEGTARARARAREQRKHEQCKRDVMTGETKR